jgi:hypothetical protein
LMGCSGASEAPGEGTGGSFATGGVAETGGTPSSGGSVSTGGVATGGSPIATGGNSAQSAGSGGSAPSIGGSSPITTGGTSTGGLGTGGLTGGTTGGVQATGGLSSGGAAGFVSSTGGLAGTSTGGTSSTGGTGTGGASVGTRSILGCGKAPKAFACPTETYLWACPDTKKPTGGYTNLSGSHASVACSAAYDAQSWCCKADATVDTRLDPAVVCPPAQRPFQFNDHVDGDFECWGAI